MMNLAIRNVSWKNCPVILIHKGEFFFKLIIGWEDQKRLNVILNARCRFQCVYIKVMFFERFKK